MKKQYAMVVEADRCLGCHACRAACKYENDIALGTSRVHTYTMGPVGEFPRLSMYFLTVHCQQCEEPACAAVCPTGACWKSDEDGVVRIDPDTCIGCRSCLKACPFRANNFNAEMRIADKCTVCDRQREAGETPACVKNCPGGALHYGDILDPESEVGRLLSANEGHVYTLKDEDGCRPSGRFILKKEKWIDMLPFEFEEALREGRYDG